MAVCDIRHRRHCDVWCVRRAFLFVGDAREHLQFTRCGKGLVLAIPLALLCLSSYLAGKFTGKNKAAKKWTGFAGMAILTASLIVTGFSSQIYFVVGMMTLGGIGIGMVLPCMDTLLTEGIEKEQRGTITSIQQYAFYRRIARTSSCLAAPRGESLGAVRHFGCRCGCRQSAHIIRREAGGKGRRYRREFIPS